jgi:pantoate--beta-alanine ligase
LCEAAGADAVFTPDKAMMYPDGFNTWVSVEVLGDKLCGRSRPGHFRGVTTVVAKLFSIVQPARAYFGQKDAQQALILKRMVRDLDLPVQMVVCPIVREPDGLAMSSRNRYLTVDERMRAIGLSKALGEVEALFNAGTRNVAILRAKLATTLADYIDKLDYAEVLDAEDLSEITEIQRPALAAVAAYVGSTRLIDNTVLQP